MNFETFYAYAYAFAFGLLFSSLIIIFVGLGIQARYEAKNSPPHPLGGSMRFPHCCEDGKTKTCWHPDATR